MEWLGSHLLRSARPFVPNIAVGNSPLNGSASTEDDQAMMQMMCDLVLGELQVEINRVEKEAVSERRGGDGVGGGEYKTLISIINSFWGV